MLPKLLFGCTIWCLFYFRWGPENKIVLWRSIIYPCVDVFFQIRNLFLFFLNIISK